MKRYTNKKDIKSDNGMLNLCGEITRMSLADLYNPLLAKKVTWSTSNKMLKEIISAFYERGNAIVYFKKSKLFQYQNLDLKYLIPRYLDDLMQTAEGNYKEFLVERYKDAESFEDLTLGNNYGRAKFLMIYREHKSDLEKIKTHIKRLDTTLKEYVLDEQREKDFTFRLKCEKENLRLEIEWLKNHEEEKERFDNEI